MTDSAFRCLLQFVPFLCLCLLFVTATFSSVLGFVQNVPPSISLPEPRTLPERTCELHSLGTRKDDTDQVNSTREGCSF
ncbi:hypothetical protein BDN70DRAFT_870270 [Pholiota conissans]|uniref:Uncharacterized protein n=1 Tax=Pholiota conissans TaxID=109636 RepID=A0A9P5ZGW0_9AGAR|nr:hypothetical protein BDN70DRAFT_870270 [Pholiota conissans]